MKHTFLGVLAGMVLLAALAAPAAHAAQVTVRVEGKDATLLPATTVTLPSTDPKPDGTNACGAATAGGALWAATSGGWSGSYFPSFSSYLVETVLGETHKYPDPYSWAYFVNGKGASAGACAQAAQQGDSLLFYIDYCVQDPSTYECTNPPILPLVVSAPATPRPGEPFTVTVTRLARDGSSAPVAGATIAGGAAPVTTDASGNAAVTVGAAGPATLLATKDGFVRDRATVCATSGADGACGTTVPGAPAAPAGPQTTTAPDTHASFGRFTGITNGKRYKKGRGPRQLAGRIDPDPSGLQDVEVRLTRRDHRRCSTYDARRERLVRMKRCGATRGTWFSVGDRERWTYLLPARLPRGRYVLDLRVTDRAGHVNERLIRGRSRLVFHVR